MQSKIIRIFISSTFREMINEREAIQRKVFLRLKNWARDYGIFLIPVDLRWGITDDDIKAGHLTRLCVDGVKACEPYFVCLLGNSYGTTDSKVLGVDSKGKSITQIEIETAISDTDSENRECRKFYFIDYSSYVEKSFIKKRKQKKLIKSIKEKGFIITPIAELRRLLDNISADIRDLIRKRHRELTARSLTEQSKMMFNNFLSSYYSSGAVSDVICGDVDLKPGKRLALDSPNGVTCDFYIYNYADHAMENKKFDIIVFHDFARSPYEKSKIGLNKHIIEAIKDELYVEYNEQLFDDSALFQFLSLAKSKGKSVGIFVNSLYLISKDEQARVAHTLSIDFDNLFVCLSETVTDNIGSFEKYRLPLLNNAAANRFIVNYLDFYFKNNNAGLTQKIIDALILENGNDVSMLFLMLEELTQKGCPTEEILSQIPSKAVLSNTEETIGYLLSNLPNADELMFSEALLASAEQYLTLNEAERLFEKEGFAIQKLYDCLDELVNLVLVADGKIYPKYFEFKSAIKKIVPDSRLESARRLLKEHFGSVAKNGKIKQEVKHAVEELFALYAAEGDSDTLIDLLFNANVFPIVVTESVSLFSDILRSGDKASEKIDLKIKELASCFRDDFEKLMIVFRFLRYCGKYELCREIINEIFVADKPPEIRFFLGYLYREEGDYSNSVKYLEPLYKELNEKHNALIMSDKKTTDNLLRTADILSYCYSKCFKFDAAEEIVNNIIRIRSYNAAEYEYDLPVSYNSLANIYFNRCEYEKAYELYVKAKNIRIRLWGNCNPRVAANINNCAECLMRSGKAGEALPLFVEAGEMFEMLLGKDHLYTVVCLENEYICRMENNGEIDLSALSELEKHLNKYGESEWMVALYYAYILFYKSGAKAKEYFSRISKVFDEQNGKDATIYYYYNKAREYLKNV